MARSLSSFFGDLFRNRHNRACTACVVVFEVWTIFALVWGVTSMRQGNLAEVPASVLAVLTLVSGWKGWKDHVDAKAAIPPPAA